MARWNFSLRANSEEGPPCTCKTGRGWLSLSTATLEILPERGQSSSGRTEKNTGSAACCVLVGRSARLLSRAEKRPGREANRRRRTADRRRRQQDYSKQLPRALRPLRSKTAMCFVTGEEYNTQQRGGFRPDSLVRIRWFDLGRVVQGGFFQALGVFLLWREPDTSLFCRWTC